MYRQLGTYVSWKCVVVPTRDLDFHKTHLVTNSSFDQLYKFITLKLNNSDSNVLEITVFNPRSENVC
jgi:hypothetical protein